MSRPLGKSTTALLQALKNIASGILPNGDHVEGQTYEYANKVLEELGIKKETHEDEDKAKLPGFENSGAW